MRPNAKKAMLVEASVRINRREFFTLVGAAGAAWPFAARAQHSEKVRLVGVLLGWTEKDANAQKRLVALRDGLAELGWIEGRNISIDHRFASGDPAHAQTIVTEMVRTAPDLIVGVRWS